MDQKLNVLLEYVKADGRIFPTRTCWDQLWEMLPKKKQIWETPLLAKTLRLNKHIRYAAEHEALDMVDSYLRGLKPVEWFYGK
jgi:hypothetical protein